MSLSGLEVEEWDEAASSSFRSRCLVLSASALLIYDMILTMSCEMNTMWQRRFRVADFVYFTNRYGGFWNALIGIALFAHYNDDQSCLTLGIIAQIATMIPNISWAAFSGLRTYALTNGNLVLGWIIFGMSATSITPTVYSIRGMQGSSFPPPLNCASWNHMASLTIIVISRATFLLSEVIVMTLTWRNTVMDQCLTRRLAPKTHSLQRVLLSNGIICLAVSFVLDGTMMAAELATRGDKSSTSVCLQQIIHVIGPFRNSITTILLSRFLLELEKLRHGCNTLLGSVGMMTTQVMYHPSDVVSAVSAPPDHV